LKWLRIIQPDIKQLIEEGVIIDTETDEIISVNWNMLKPQILLLTRKPPKQWPRAGGLTR